MLGAGFDYSYLPSSGSRRGIVVAWKSACWSVSSTVLSHCLVSIKLKHASGGVNWWLSSVYRLSIDAEKAAFLDELRQFRTTHVSPWLIVDDFNMIYQAADKNNDRLNQRLMGQFWCFLNDSVLKELHLTDRLFTWSNEHSHPTLEHIDRDFLSTDREDIYPSCGL
jgi:hypothetical protein